MMRFRETRADLRLLANPAAASMPFRRRSKPDAEGPERLRELVASGVSPGGLVIVANRQPYAHHWDPDGTAVVRRPASGLVSALEPMLRACGGRWIAYGDGPADRAHADSQGRLAVPPDSPEYYLRRIWLGENEYERYYSGFANESLWPLCHLVHTRPSFRSADWTAYQTVNATFAQAAIEETPRDGLLLIQDYHFALVPRIVRVHAPEIVSSLFWHIPWPNPEMIGICPWKEALLEGMVGADIIGFHTRDHCLNFLESVQRYLECRVDVGAMSIDYGGHRTLVGAYPISVEWPFRSASRSEGFLLRNALGIAADVHISVGVDRADYTKGLIERVSAVELLLENNPSIRGKYVLVQLAAPTRTGIQKYRELAEELQQSVRRVNERFGTETWMPILLQMRAFSPEEVRVHYAMANSVLVTPLHDGMNLVAKEYVASCHDHDGALVLSIFAGAAKELDGALLVNPYDTEETSQAILRVIRMPLSERKARMDAMRQRVSSNSIYHWSEKLLTDMLTVRQSRGRFWPAGRLSAERADEEMR